MSLYDNDRADIAFLANSVELLLDALAKRILAEWNEREGDNWPAGQSWDELVTTSHAIFRQLARQEAGLDRSPAWRSTMEEIYARYEIDYDEITAHVRTSENRISGAGAENNG